MAKKKKALKKKTSRRSVSESLQELNKQALHGNTKTPEERGYSVCLSISGELKEEVDKYAKRHKKTRTWIARRALMKFLKL